MKAEILFYREDQSPIKREQVDLYDEATSLHIVPYIGHEPIRHTPGSSGTHQVIEIPRPKKLVKKWQWSFITYGTLEVITKDHLSEEEFYSWQRGRSNAACAGDRRIPESMIEVDEP